MTRSVDIAVATFRRPEGLLRTLESVLAEASAGAGWDIGRILVVDNDPDASARTVVESLPSGAVPVGYVHEPTPGISAARNRALEESDADVLVMLDDDETVVRNWPAGLLATMDRTGAIMVGGPVVVETEIDVEPWFVSAITRPRHDDDASIDRISTANFAIDRSVRSTLDPVFDPAFGLRGGSDTKLSRDLVIAGHRLAWSDQAVLCEHFPASRCTEAWIERRWERGGETMTSVELATATDRLRPLTAARHLATSTVRTTLGLGFDRLGRLLGDQPLRRRGVRWRRLAIGQRRAIRGHHSIAYGPTGFDSPKAIA